MKNKNATDGNEIIHFSIRVATPQDSVEVLDCLKSAFVPYQAVYTAGAFADTILNWESLQQRFLTMQILLATDAEDIVRGTISYSVFNGIGHIRGMAVRPGYQGSGVAGALLARVESDLSGLHCSAVTLGTTRPLCRAISFYERNGFLQTGKVDSFFGMELIEYKKELRRL